MVDNKNKKTITIELSGEDAEILKLVSGYMHCSARETVSKILSSTIKPLKQRIENAIHF